jgi:hypothetical protein
MSLKGIFPQIQSNVKCRVIGAAQAGHKQGGGRVIGMRLQLLSRPILASHIEAVRPQTYHSFVRLVFSLRASRQTLQSFPAPTKTHLRIKHQHFVGMPTQRTSHQARGVRNLVLEPNVVTSALKMETACFFETLVSICESTRRHNPEQQHCRILD